MGAIESISNQSAGATFFRADLHVHCFGGSHDVADTTMTPEAVVATAVAENLSLVAIADHNEISCVERAIAAAQGTSVLVVPAIELSTIQGHLLCYFPTLAILRRFHGQLSLVDSGLPTSRCQQSMLECLNLVQQLGGFGILAHVDSPAGLEVQMLYALERVALHDLPRLQVTKRVINADGAERFVRKDFSKLSLGQQQSVLLALMLSADTDRPLIIDQPEDNLDGEFIYSTLVPVLRRAKERRQVIIVTHNANVAVLGDAEQIVVMKAANDRGEIVARGSIDHQPTRDAACAILEGAKEAFLRRAKMYGVSVR